MGIVRLLFTSRRQPLLSMWALEISKLQGWGSILASVCRWLELKSVQLILRDRRYLRWRRADAAHILLSLKESCDTFSDVRCSNVALPSIQWGRWYPLVLLRYGPKLPINADFREILETHPHSFETICIWELCSNVHMKITLLIVPLIRSSK